MDVKEIRPSLFSASPSFFDLFRVVGTVIREWWDARFYDVDFHELPQSEVTEELARMAAAARALPREEFIDI